MKRNDLLLLVVVGAMMFSAPAFAVSEAAILSLLISPSPQANALGESYGTLWSDDPMSSAFNPAAVGLQAQKTFVGNAFYPERTYWLPEFGHDMWYDVKAFNFGFNLRSVSKIPVAVGYGHFNAHLNLGEQINTDETGNIIGVFDSFEKYSSDVYSIAFDYYLRGSFGYAAKSIDSKLAGTIMIGGSQYEARVQPKAHDWGLIIQAPVCDILQKLGKSTTISEKLAPFFTPGFYYSKRNIGDSVAYIPGEADPLPRQAYIGINFETGLRFNSKATAFDILHFRWAREMDDILVERESSGAWKYVSGLHDIKFWENVIFGKANPKATMHQGYQIGLADVAFFRRGHYEDIEGKVYFDSRGYGVNFIQPLRILAALLDYQGDKLWLNVLLAFDVEYNESHWDVIAGHPVHNTEFKGLTLRLRQFQF